MDRDEFTRRALDMEYSLYRVAKTLLRSDDDCADAVQESLVKGLLAARGLRQAEYFKTWMTRILVNTCKDMLKKQARRSVVEVPEALPAKDDTEQRELYEALQTIPEELRLPLVLHYLEGLTVTTPPSRSFLKTSANCRSATARIRSQRINSSQSLTASPA